MKRLDPSVEVRQPIPRTADSNEVVTEEEKLLVTYESLRAELRTRIRMAGRRKTRGIAVLGAIIGSAIVEDFHLLVFVPIAVGFLFVESMRSYEETLVVARHLIDVERELAEGNSPVRYETQWGGAFGKRRVRPRIISFEWTTIPKVIQLLLLGLTYLAVGLILVSGWNPPPELFGYEIKRSYVGIGFGVLTALLLVPGISFVVRRQRLLAEIEADES